MLSDRQLRDYVEGALLPAQRAELERLLADVPNTLREVVAQERIDQALRVAFGDAAIQARIKQSILAIMIETPLPEIGMSAAKSSPARTAPRPKQKPVKRWRPAKLAGLAAVIGLAVLIIIHLLGNIARIDVAASGTELIRNGKPGSVRAGQQLRKEDALRVGENAVVEYRDATLLKLGAGSRATFSKTAARGGKRVDVRAGKLSAVVRPQPPDEPMVIASQQAVVTATCATFTLAVDPAQTCVELSEGALHVERLSDKTAVDLKAGEFAEAGSDGEFVAHPLHPEPTKSE